MKLLNSNQKNTSLCCFPKCSLKSEVKTNEISRDTLVIHFFWIFSARNTTHISQRKRTEAAIELSEMNIFESAILHTVKFSCKWCSIFWQTVAQTFSRTETTIELSNTIVVFFHYLQLKNIHTLIKINHGRN